jgi:transposase
MHDAIEQAYERGDHRAARAHAAQVLAEATDAAACRERAAAILDYTSPDRFLALVGALGLGLVAWLVYNYVL